MAVTCNHVTVTGVKLKTKKKKNGGKTEIYYLKINKYYRLKKKTFLFHKIIFILSLVYLASMPSSLLIRVSSPPRLYQRPASSTSFSYLLVLTRLYLLDAFLSLFFRSSFFFPFALLCLCLSLIILLFHLSCCPLSLFILISFLL